LETFLLLLDDRKKRPGHVHNSIEADVETTVPSLVITDNVVLGYTVVKHLASTGG
jgi:hypothetical protein